METKNITSGKKYVSSQGCTAIKDGVKSRSNDAKPLHTKPGWFNVKAMNTSENFQELKKTVKDYRLNTVCEEAKCPNIFECWSAGTATLMVLGSVCTRACKFCAVDTGNPNGWVDPLEPVHCARTTKMMDLKYVVITSVDRDDLPDGGAKHYADCVVEIKKACPQTYVETLAPDFQGDTKDLETLLGSGVDVFSQNIETVERLTHPVRDPRAGYQQTLDVLYHAKQYRDDVITKTGIMLGLGETRDEVVKTMDDLRAHEVDVITLGQYLQPTKNHLDVECFVSPAEFKALEEIAYQKGFLDVASGPMVRSSYRADKLIEKLNKK